MSTQKKRELKNCIITLLSFLPFLFFFHNPCFVMSAKPRPFNAETYDSIRINAEGVNLPRVCVGLLEQFIQAVTATEIPTIPVVAPTYHVSFGATFDECFSAPLKVVSDINTAKDNPTELRYVLVTPPSS